MNTLIKCRTTYNRSIYQNATYNHARRKYFARNFRQFFDRRPANLVAEVTIAPAESCFEVSVGRCGAKCERACNLSDSGTQPLVTKGTGVT